MFGKREQWTVLVCRGNEWDVQWLEPGTKAEAQKAAKKLNDSAYPGFWYEAVSISEALETGFTEYSLGLTND